jgi:hypothetical protein
MIVWGRKVGLGALALLFPGTSACGKDTPPEPEIEWYTRIAPACAAAEREGKPLLFINWGSFDVVTKELEHTTFADPRVRRALHRDWIALKVDRSDVYMAEGSGSEQEREVEAAARRFEPAASKAATLVMTAPDCTTRLGWHYGYEEPAPFLWRLDGVKKKLRG